MRFFELSSVLGKLCGDNTLKNKHAVQIKRRNHIEKTVYKMGIVSVITAPMLLIYAPHVIADSTFLPNGFCTRSAIGSSDVPYTCIVPTANGGQAVISDVPAAPLGNGVDPTFLDDWASSNLGANSHVVGDVTTSASGSNSVAIGSGASASTDNSVALGAGSVTQDVIATTGVTIAGKDYSFAGSEPVGTVSVGSEGGERTVTNVAAGQVSATSTDAVNGSQLHATNQAVDALDNIAVKYDTNPDGTKSNSITLAGGDPNQPVVLANVAAGTRDTDAVNLSQLNAVIGGNTTQTYSYIDNRINQAFAETKNYIDNKFSELNANIDGVRDDAHRSAAIGLAAASLRYDDNPGKLSVAVGGGLWRGQSAVAFGAGYTNEDSTIRANLSGTTSGGRVGVGAGLSFTLN